MRLDPWFRRALYAVMSTLFVTGVSWLVMDGLKHGATGSRTSAALLMLHGGAAMLMLVLLGSILPFHVRVAWRRQRNRTTGAAMLAANAVLIATAFGLYYAGSDTVRGWLGDVHTAVGLGLPVLWALHVVRGRRSRRRAPHQRVSLSPVLDERRPHGRLHQE